MSFSQQIYKMKHLGGSTIGQRVRNIMKSSFSDTVMFECSWTGIGKTPKIRFQKFEVIIKAIKKALLSNSSTEHDIEMHIKNWVRHAKERLNVSQEIDTTEQTTP